VAKVELLVSLPCEINTRCGFYVAFNINAPQIPTLILCLLSLSEAAKWWYLVAEHGYHLVLMMQQFVLVSQSEIFPKDFAPVVSTQNLET